MADIIGKSCFGTLLRARPVYIRLRPLRSSRGSQLVRQEIQRLYNSSRNGFSTSASASNSGTGINASTQTSTITDKSTSTAPASSPSQPSSSDEVFLSTVLPSPTISVRSLLPSPDAPADPIITSTKLHRLLHLSALPPPTSPEEETSMLKDLNEQLHFVRNIQTVDTSNVKPCVGITYYQHVLYNQKKNGGEEGEEEGLTLEDIQKAEEEEEKVGAMGTVEWDAVALAGQKIGRHFVVPGEEGEEEKI